MHKSAAVIERIDPNMATVDPASGTRWFDLSRLEVEGRGFSDTENFYDRLPARAKGVVRDAVWELSRCSAGLCARFVTDADTISARWTLRLKELAMDHMPASGVSGVDLYVRHEGQWRWLGAGRAIEFPTNSRVLVAGITREPREYLLYLPLYNGVEKVELGLPGGAALAKAPPRGASKPIVFYGTSIVQGACAARPGMAYPAMVGRALDWPVLNLGFSGNAKLEPEVADLLAELDPAAFVLDPLPNVQEPLITQLLPPMVKKLRVARPQTPIVLVESITYQNGFMLEDSYKRYTASNAALRRLHEQMRGEGISNLHYVEGAALLGDDGEATVDGTHATDLGFRRMADVLIGVLRRVLTKG